MAETTKVRAARRAVLVTVAVDCAETVGLAVVALLTGSVGLRAQTAAAAADLAVQVFLLIGVLRSVRPPDEHHPLGYGREGFFWSLFAALGIFVGGGALGIDQAIHAALRPSAVRSYPIGYLVLVTTLALDAYALEVALRPVRGQATRGGVSLRNYLRRNTDPALTTNVVGGGCAVIGGVAAVAGLALSELTGSPLPDTLAGGLIGLLLLFASVLLVGTNRQLLSGRGVPQPMVSEMSEIIASQAGVVDVPDLFAVVIGPSSLIVNGDVTFADDLDVPAVENTIARCTAALKQRWPAIDYVYLTPVARARPRRLRSDARGAGKKPGPHRGPGLNSGTEG